MREGFGLRASGFRRVMTIAFVIAACSPVDRGPRWRAAGNAAPRNGGTLRFATRGAISTLDPTLEYDEVSGFAVHALFDTLVAYEPARRGDPTSGTALVPSLAASWQVSPDGLTYTFALRPGITYSDGTPLVARDFVFGLERALTAPDSPFAGMLGAIEGAADATAGHAPHCRGLVAPADDTLVIHLVHRDAAFLLLLAMPFATPQRADHVAAAGDQLRREPLGSGPFVLERWDEGAELVLRRNPRYWNAAHVHLDAIVQLESVPRDVQFMMFERGDLDSVAELAAPDALWLAAQPAWQPYLLRRASMTAFGSRMNVRVPPFDDVRVRQALNYALDKDHSVKLLEGGALPAHGILPPGVLGRDDTLAPYPHDPARARALLTDAGYPHGFDVAYAIMDDEEAERLAGSLQSDLAEVGVRVHVQVMSLPAWATAIGRADGPAFSKATWLADYPDPASFLDVFDSRLIANADSIDNTFYQNPVLDVLLDEARAELDPARRAALYRRAERILYDDAPWIWDYHQLATEVIQPYVRGYAIHPVWLRDYTTAWLDLGADGRRVPR